MSRRRFPFRLFKSWFPLWIPITLLSLTPIFSNWLANRYQVTAEDLVLPIFLCIATASFVSSIFFKLYHREPLTGYLAAIFSTLVIGNIDYTSRLETVTPIFRILTPYTKLKSWEELVVSLTFVILVVLLTKWLARRIASYCAARDWNPADITGGLTICISVIFLLQAYSVGKAVVTTWPQFLYRPPELASNARIQPGIGKPDIYYIVLDRYGSSELLKDQFNFDNSQFTHSLADQGFYVAPNSHQNYPYTTMSIASTLNANYHTDIVQKFGQASEQTLDPYHEAVRYSSVIQTFKNLGYQYDLLGSWYEVSNKTPLADHIYQPEGKLTILGVTFTLNSFAKSTLIHSLWGPTVEKGWHIGDFSLLSYSSLGEAEATTYKLKVLNNLAQQPSGGRFIFTHLLIPHDPYYFNADGSMNPYTGNDNLGQPIKQKYVNQVQYINSQITPILATIKERSGGKALIILQSDEGPYPMQLNDEEFNGDKVEEEVAAGSMLTWSDKDLLMKYSNLAAYYLPGAPATELAQAGDTVNIFRLVLNTYFGDRFSYLPRCYYAYTNGRSEPFVYADITKRLTGMENPACPINSNFKK